MAELKAEAPLADEDQKPIDPPIDLAVSKPVEELPAGEASPAEA